ncbi:hypothetical protein GCM10010441_03220 [Kitasatospora paracochleata]|uniref:Heavy-metal-associated domain-containing protein n=1 Tax=Kitasatospora paracochleata TaxID=58354 RepID=A0ABT1J2D2_9ACTN|nr:hypothetical protein [Kitasatospora paracochleata]MCP2311562.1 hypothetical protein [Kitasatospora paracochleata]
MTNRWMGHRFLLACSLVVAVGAIALLALGTRSSSADPEHTMPAMAGMDHGGTATPGVASPGPGGMPGMAGMAVGDGLTAERDGYRLDSRVGDLPAGQAVGYPFTVIGPDGRPVTDFADAQTRKLHFYAIRSDLTGYQHLHPVMAADGTWTADLAALEPGDWRLYASFTPSGGPGRNREFVLSRTVTVPGPATAQPLPAATGSATVDGYTVTVQGDLTAGTAGPLTVTVSRDGRPVTDLQPYLDSYAHLSAFHQDDLALAHLHPITRLDGDHGGPTLTFYALLGKPGNWRVYLQFQTAGQLHTAALTLHVG